MSRPIVCDGCQVQASPGQPLLGWVENIKMPNLPPADLCQVCRDKAMMQFLMTPPELRKP
jgi:hypothetical protein